MIAKIINQLALIFLFWVCWAGCLPAQNVQQGGNLHRVFIVDHSGSMRNEHLATVKREILTLANQFPPSNNSPISVIKFGTAASEPEVFTDLSEIQKFVDDLEANGGSTNIPKALLKTVDVVGRYPDTNVMAFLFSDGKNEVDGDQMPKAIEAMNDLFNERKQRNLSNIVVLKQWGQHHQLNDGLDAMQKAGLIQLHQSDGVEIVSARITPKLTVTHVQRDSKQIDQLLVTAVAQLEVTGVPPASISLDFQLADRNQQNFKPVNVSEGTATPIDLKLKLTVDEETRKEVLLKYSVSQPQTKQDGKQLFVPQLTSATLTVPVVVPESIFNRLTVVKPHVLPTVPRWTDINTLEAEFDLELEFEVRSIKQDRAAPSTFEIGCLPPARIISGPKRVRIKPNSSESHVYKFRTQSKSTNALDFGLVIETRAVDLPANVKCENPNIRIPLDYLTPPPQLVTVLKPVLVGVKNHRWISVQDQSVEHQARFNIVAEGPVVPSGKFSVVKTPSLAMRVDSPSLSDKDSTVDVTIRSRVSGSQLDFQYQFLPPKETLAVRYEMKEPVAYTLQPPKPVKLQLAVHPRFVVDSSQTSLRIPVTVGVSRTHVSACQSVPINLETDGVNLKQDSISAALGKTSAMPVSFEPLGNTSFWFDTRKKCSIQAVSSSNWMIPENGSFELVAQAPFKKILYGLVVMGCVAILGWGAWLGIKPSKRKVTTE